MNRSSDPPFWAKVGDDPQDYHPLIGHSADVAAVLEALVRPPGVIHRRLLSASGGADADPVAVVAVLTYLAAIHDIGKTQHGFQDKEGPLARKGRWPWAVSGHVRPVVDTFSRRVHLDTWIDLVRGLPWDDYERQDLLFTTICHHGRPWEAGGRLTQNQLADLWTRDTRTGRNPLRRIQFIGEAARRWAGVPDGGWASPPFEWTAPLANLFAGLLVTADWVGSSRSIFDFDRSSALDPDGYWQRARTIARRAVRDIGLRPPGRTLDAEGDELYRKAFPRVFGEGITPTSLQRLLATVELPAPGSRVVVESDTGSGKTEAILALYARLRDAGRVDGLAFALPTRATALSMLKRLEDCLDSLHPGDEPPTVALAMGGAVVDPDLRRTPLPSEGTMYDEDDDAFLRQWASEHAKRFFAAEIVVGTVDQVLLAGLPVKHAHHRVGLLSRHLLVVDELHSYDVYMGTILNSVVDLLCGTGGIAAFLSATLSSGALHRLTGEEDPTTLREATDADYPSVSIHTRAWERYPTRREGHSREVRWGLGTSAEGLDRAIALAREGARVCILRNTVRDARETTTILREDVPELLWHPPGTHRGVPVHSRYIAGDRRVLDESVIRDFGKGSTASGTILVSTQIVEQSLDVDFDWMFTDLAPVDVLLQRLGRVHRHARRWRPPSAPGPSLLIHGPDEGFPPQPRYRTDYGWGTVYEGILDLELTRRLIERHPTIGIPRMARQLIEEVYHGQVREELVKAEPEWEDVEIEETGQGSAQRIHGRQAALDFRKTYLDLAVRFAAADEEKLRTRIGDDRVSVPLERPVAGWYASAAMAEEVALRIRDVHRAGLDDEDDLVARWVGDTDDEPTYRFGKLRLSYSREGWTIAADS